jgi:hypothetical protein
MSVRSYAFQNEKVNFSLSPLRYRQQSRLQGSQVYRVEECSITFKQTCQKNDADADYSLFFKFKGSRPLQSSAATRIAKRVRPVISHDVQYYAEPGGAPIVANRMRFDDVSAALGLVVG